MIKCFIKFSSPDNFQDKEVIWSRKKNSESVNWSKYNAVSTEKYYFLDTIIWLSVSLQFDLSVSLGSPETHFMYMEVKVTFTLMKQYNKSIKCRNSKSIVFSNLWKMIAANYELLQVIFEHVLN